MQILVLHGKCVTKSHKRVDICHFGKLIPKNEYLIQHNIFMCIMLEKYMYFLFTIYYILHVIVFFSIYSVFHKSGRLF